LAGGRYVDRAGDAVAASHAHFPEPAVKVLHVGLAHLRDAVPLDQRPDPVEPGADVGRKLLKFGRDRGVHKRDNP